MTFCMHRILLGAPVALALLLGVAWMVLPADAAPESPSESDAADSYNDQQIAIINKYIRQGWTDNELKPSKAATDGEWCRRVYLDVIGRIPSVNELEAFVKDKSPDKKAKLVDRLLGEDYIEDYARNWTTLWTNTLIGRTGGTGDDMMTSRPGMQQYLRRALQRNKPYDQIVRELITATGTTAPGTSKFNGATNFLASKYEEQAALATAKTSQIFLGLQVQCTQCHNHPFNDWKQNQFWEMNAFFRQSRPLRAFDGGDVSGVELVDESWAGEGGNAAEAELYYELRNGLVKVAYPVFVDGTALTDLHGEDIGNSGYLEDVNRRQELAKLVLKSEYMPKAIVNRYWSHFLGYGFTKPIDDMGPHNPPTHPELLAELGTQFREHSFDLKQLIRWITLSEAYSLSSQMSSNNQRDDPQLGERPMFSHFYLRQMTAEQLYESLLTATRAEQTQGGKAEEAKQKWLEQFNIAFGTDEGDDMTTFAGTIPQALMMMNGDLVKNALNIKQGSFLATVGHSNLSAANKIKYLYKAALSREPGSRELGVANQLLARRKGNIAEAMQDIFWVLLNTNEFILIH
jgi:hypothetical protein